MQSPRVEFQLKYFSIAPHNEENPRILNVGSCDDPIHLGDVAMHVDIDDWSAANKHFTQSDAEKMPFADKSYHTVILGDMLEHVVSPLNVITESARCVETGGYLVLTVFEEWRLPGHGQFIAEGQALGDKVSQEMGYADRQDFQVKEFPLRKGVDDNETPHLIHINQFNDEDMQNLIGFIVSLGFEAIELLKAPEAVHENHQWYNWLMSFRRVS